MRLLIALCALGTMGLLASTAIDPAPPSLCLSTEATVNQVTNAAIPATVNNVVVFEVNESLSPANQTNAVGNKSGGSQTRLEIVLTGNNGFVFNNARISSVANTNTT